MDFRGCLRIARRCCPSDGAEGEACVGLDACVQAAQAPGLLANLYYGASASPRWLRGLGWVLGRIPVEFIGENAEDIKVRGAPDMALAFWLAALEDIHFAD